MKTVAEEVVTAAGAPQEGIMQMARSLNPNTNMAQDTGLAQAAPVTPTQAPQPQAPQMMSDGGIMRLQTGGGPLLGDLSPAALELSLNGTYGSDVQNEAVSKAIMGLYGPEMQSDIIAKAISGLYGPEVQQKAESLPGVSSATGSNEGGAGIASVSADVADFDATSNAGSGFGSNIEYTYDTFLNENSLNDSPQAREMFSNYKSYMDTRDPPSDPQLFSAMNFDESPQGLTSVSSQAVDFMPRSGEFTRPELSGSPQILNELSVEPDADFVRQTSPAAPPPSILDQLRSSVYSNNPLEDALAGTGLNSNVIGDDIIDPVMSRFAEAASREGMPSQTAADIANETALRNREMASENAGRLTAEELLAPAPRAYDVTDTRSGRPRAQGIASFGVFDPIVDRFKEIRSEDAARNAAAAEGDLGAFLDVGSENDPAFLSSAMDGFSPMAEVSTLSGDNFNNDPATGYSYPTDLPPLDPRMEGREVAGRVMDALTEGEGSSLPEDIYGGYENPEAIARRQEIERMISLEPLGEGRQSDVETILKDRIADGGPNLVIQDEVIPASESEKRREAAEDGGGITSLNPVVPDDDAGGSTTPSGGAYGSIESRIAKMLSDRESSAEADKWMALAQTGMALMASKNPTFGGALGEAGLAGVGALQKSRKAYDADIMNLLGMQQKIQSAKSLDAARAAKSTTGGSKALNTAIDNAQAELNSLMTEARSYRRVVPGDAGMGTVDRVIEKLPEKLKGDIDTARERLATLQRIALGGGAQFDATQ